MSVSKDTVKHVARLARIAVSDDEAEVMTGELSSILDWIEQLNEVDVEGVEPMTSVVEMEMKKRADIVTEGDIPDKIIGNAPAEDDHFLMVPKVVE